MATIEEETPGCGDSGPVRSVVLRALENECRHTIETHPPKGADDCGECGHLADLVCNALGDWLYGQQKRTEASEAYKRGRTDGYRQAFDLFGPELDTLRAFRAAHPGSPGGSGD